MEQMKQVLSASLVWRWLTAVCLWFSRQWERSGLVQWFLHPAGWNRASSERSVFFKLWSLVRRGLCWLYDKLRLEKLFAGSIFTRTWLWCAIPVVLAPMLAVSRPSLITMGLAAIGYASLLLNLVRDRGASVGLVPGQPSISSSTPAFIWRALFSRWTLRAAFSPACCRWPSFCSLSCCTTG